MYQNWSPRLEIMKLSNWYECNTLINVLNKLLDQILTDLQKFSKLKEPYFNVQVMLFSEHNRYPKKRDYFCDVEFKIFEIRKLYNDFRFANTMFFIAYKKQLYDQLYIYIKEKNDKRDLLVKSIQVLITEMKNGEVPIYNREKFEKEYNAKWC